MVNGCTYFYMLIKVVQLMEYSIEIKFWMLYVEFQAKFLIYNFYSLAIQTISTRKLACQIFRLKSHRKYLLLTYRQLLHLVHYSKIFIIDEDYSGKEQNSLQEDVIVLMIGKEQNSLQKDVIVVMIKNSPLHSCLTLRSRVM